MGWVSTLISRRTFRIWGLAAVLVVAMAALAGGIAFGTTTTCSNTATLNGSAFEIEANANQVVNTTGCKDWLNTGPGAGPIIKQDSPSGANDESFGEGTKEDTALPTVVSGSIPPNKSDLKAFGVYTETGEVTLGNPTGKFLELLWTRVQDPSGTTNMDFELNQKLCDLNANPTNCAPNNLTPLRTSGDKLITYDLSRGGTVATISIRTWNGSAWGSPTVLTGSSAQARGTVNTSQITAANSLASLNPPLDPRTFGEASISFGALFGENTCGQFGSAYLKSRSSDSFSAALKDFVPPQAVTISNCAALTTNASNTPGTDDPPATIGDSISDVATLSGVTPTAGGTITFKLYGPNDANCTGTVVDTKVVNVSGPGNYPSGAVTPTAVGTYRWTANYSGDANNQSASSLCNAANESSLIVKKQPTISTNATANVTVGESISDTATLGNVTTDASGTITFKAYGPDDANCTGAAAFTSTKTVSGPGDYTSDPFTPTAVGTYRWIASYDGDAKNLAVSGSCNDANESSVVGKDQPAIVTNASNPQSNPAIVGDPISDTATLSGATNDAGGTITFKLYSDDQCTNEINTGLGPVPVNGNGDYDSGDYTTTAPGTYYWIASYSGDAKNLAVSGECGDPNESSVVAQKQPEISTNATANVTIGEPISDTATLSGATSDASGTITFKLYSDDQCQNEVNTGLSPVTVSGNGDYDSGNFTPTAPGTYYWIASYSGDDKNLEVSGECGDANESSVVEKAPANIATAQELFPQDSATLSATAGGTPTGTVTFKLYGPDNPTCSESGAAPVYTESDVTLTNGTANTDNTTFSVNQAKSGNYKWLVTYSGDEDHNDATSACGKEAFTANIDDDTTN